MNLGRRQCFSDTHEIFSYRKVDLLECRREGFPPGRHFIFYFNLLNVEQVSLYPVKFTMAKHCIEVSINGERVCRAGVEDPARLSAMLRWFGPPEMEGQPPSMERGYINASVHGYVGEDELTWLKDRRLKVGDTATFKVVEFENIDLPEFPTAEDIERSRMASRRMYEHLEKKYGEGSS